MATGQLPLAELIHLSKESGLHPGVTFIVGQPLFPSRAGLGVLGDIWALITPKVRAYKCIKRGFVGRCKGRFGKVEEKTKQRYKLVFMFTRTDAW